SSSTMNWVLGSASTTVPSTSILSSCFFCSFLAIHFLATLTQDRKPLPASGSGRRIPICQRTQSPLASLSFALAAACTANRLLLFDAAQLALGNMPAFAAYRAQNAAVGHALAKPPQQRFLRLVRFQSDRCHIVRPHPLPYGILQ